jgi:hypothetical protein
MNKRMIFLVFSLVALFLLGGALMVKDGAAQSTPGWLSFDGSIAPAIPVLVLLNASSQSIELEANLPGAQTETVRAQGQVFTRLFGTGYGYPATAGQPGLPILRREVEIPFGAQVSVELVSAQYIDVSLQELSLYPIYPMQPSLVKLDSAEDNQVFSLDAKAYTQSGLAPAIPLATGQPYIVRGHRIIPVEVWPVAYDPVAGTVRLYSQVTFRLRLEGADMALTRSLAQRYASPGFTASLSQRVLNFNQGQVVPVNSTIGFLIITADAYYDAMLPFVALRENRGFDVTLTRLSQIPGGTTNQDIKDYIQNAYNNWPVPPSYVLLVGDTDTIPTWTGPVIGTSTDLYYGTMDGGGDWHPDIGRGRFPVRSVAQTTIMVDKYLAYANLTGQEAWLKTTSWPATCDVYEVAEGTHNYVSDNYTAPGGWTGTFPTDPQPGGDKLYCVTYSATHQDLIDAFNQGRWAIIYSGHGSYGGWEMDFTPQDVQNLTNDGMFPFVASHACLSGDFGQPEVYGETWVLQENRGALVFWGSSTYSYWGEDDILERAMFDSLFSGAQPTVDVSTMTDAGLAGVETVYPGSAQYYWETYNILGDPAVKLFLQPDLPNFTLELEPTNLEVCTAGTVNSTVQIGSVMGYTETVYLENGSLPEYVNATIDPAEATAPYTATLTLDISPGASLGDHTIAITATDQVSWTHSTDLGLRILAEAPAAPALLTPPDASLDQPLQPVFTWETSPFASLYAFQLADSAAFEEPLVDLNNLDQTSYQLADPLTAGRCYWWRTSAANSCGTSAWSPVFHFGTELIVSDFSDDMENGPDLWDHAADQGLDEWTLQSGNAHSPTQAWFVPNGESITDSALFNLQAVDIQPNSQLIFWHSFSFEPGYDGAVLEYSTDHETWLDLGEKILENGYSGPLPVDYGNPLGGRQAWMDATDGWVQVTVDLSDLAGSSIWLRWRFGSDSSVSAEGWYIDDVEIRYPQAPNPAPEITAIYPNQGNPLYPTPVEINGSNFLEMPSLSLGETWLVSVTLVNSTTLQAVVPAGLAPGIYDLILYNGDCQQAALPQAFNVTSVSYTVTLPIVVKSP